MATPAEITEIVNAIVKASSTPPICRFDHCMPNAEWAYWVQAGGAVLALFVTVLIVLYQQLLSSRSTKERRDNYERAAFLAINLAKQSAKEFGKVISDPQLAVSYATRHQEGRFDEATRALSECPPAEFRGETAILLVKARKMYATMRWQAAVVCAELSSTLNSSTTKISSRSLFKIWRTSNASSLNSVQPARRQS